MNTEVILNADNGLAIYSPFRARVAGIVAQNKAMVFDYASPKGQKEARSYVNTLRLTKKPIDDCRVKAKADSLEYGRRVDGEAKMLIGIIDGMIDQHMRPIIEIEAREAQRVAAIRAQIDFIGSIHATAMDSPDVIRAEQARLSAVVIDDSLAEFEAEACTVYEAKHEELDVALRGAIDREERDAEILVLRAESAARAQSDRDRAIADQAIAKARIEAERAAQDAERLAIAEKEAAQARERAEKARADRAEADAAAAMASSQRAAHDAVERERLERAAQEAAETAASAVREADIEHRRAINCAIADALCKHAGLARNEAKSVTVALFSGKIPHITVSY